MKSISVIDYGMSNLLSICRAFEHIGAKVNLIHEADQIKTADYLVLPGVGAFPDGMKALHSKYLPDAIYEFVNTGKPLLGVCLGMQMLLSKGMEHTKTNGLNLIKGEVLPLPKSMLGYKVPNINWHLVTEPYEGRWRESIFEKSIRESYFYFVHSYYVIPENKRDQLGITRFGNLAFTSAVQMNNIIGTQFHPEKSGENGLNLLRSFLKS